jgi:uncharacterized protein YacL
MVIWIIRAIFVVMILSLMLLGLQEGGPFDMPDSDTPFGTILVCVIVLLLGLWIDLFVTGKSLKDLAGVFFGLMVGLVLALAFNNIIDALYHAYNFDVAKEGLHAVVTVLCCYLAIIFIMQTKEDFRFIIPYVEFSKQTKGGLPLILDTSVIIDGRIADIATTGIIISPLVVPRFVLDELQLVADSANSLKRVRGRRGLDMLNKLQTNKDIDFEIQDIHLSPAEEKEPVDLKLVSTAVKLQGHVVTNDYNLNKVAQLRGVTVVNINDLANAMKSIMLPGEIITTRIVKAGDQQGQGVGYLDDGTMIVAEDARQSIGKDIRVVVTSVLQTSAGRMIFGKNEKSPNGRENNNRSYSRS